MNAVSGENPGYKLGEVVEVEDDRPTQSALSELLLRDDGTGLGPCLTAAVSVGTPNCG